MLSIDCNITSENLGTSYVWDYVSNITFVYTSTYQIPWVNGTKKRNSFDLHHLISLFTQIFFQTVTCIIHFFDSPFLAKNRYARDKDQLLSWKMADILFLGFVCTSNVSKGQKSRDYHFSVYVYTIKLNDKLFKIALNSCNYLETMKWWWLSLWDAIDSQRRTTPWLLLTTTSCCYVNRFTL